MRAWATILLIALLPMPVLAQMERPEPRPTQNTGVINGPSAPAPKPDAPETTSKAPAEPADAPPIHTTLREDDFGYSACLLELTFLGADYDEIAPVTDPEHRDCGIDRPIRLRSPLPGIKIAGDAVMRCDTARHLSHWLRDFVRPAVALLPDQPLLTGIEPGSTYQCRPTIGNGDSKISEHAFGNAFDIAAFRFQDGSRIEIKPRQDEGDMAEAFQRAIRGSACLHFTTVLGPGANAAHESHLHLDIKARKGGYRLCQ
ncbi:extensin family protein [Paracoccus aestuariivivens]|uniref:Extensin n=1 Tax=Paracoccus aestuariivivens TaxID=1820333 RepID=A0A6L6JDW1_9RHOB|nr:extensin family protein [Paracoccus aestuariivivens]MTH78919.1 extensin [Paracoccus aestuariivivens]